MDDPPPPSATTGDGLDVQLPEDRGGAARSSRRPILRWLLLSGALANVFLYHRRVAGGVASRGQQRRYDEDAPIPVRSGRRRALEKSDGTASIEDGNCNRILLYASDLVATNGVAHQVAFYVLASALAVLTDAALVILDPPANGGAWASAGGSPFGCPHENAGEDCRGLPGGLSRIIRVPRWLSRGCDVPCAKAHSYDDWVRMAHDGPADNFPWATCTDERGDRSDEQPQSNVEVLPIGRFYMEVFFKRRMFDQRGRGKEWERRTAEWSMRLGASTDEIDGFLGNNSTSQSDYLSALLSRRGVTFQPWVVRDVNASLALLDNLPIPGVSSAENGSQPRLLGKSTENAGYDAMHIRRGDRVGTKESAAEVQRYWNRRGHRPRRKLVLGQNATINRARLASAYPTEYVPFEQYWQTYNSSECPQSGRNSSAHSLPAVRSVYVATDDVNTVRMEIANLTTTHGPEYWTHCNQSIEFVFYPEGQHAQHIHESANNRGQGNVSALDEGYQRYQRSISSLTDLQILSQSDVFVGVVHSFWGRFLRLLRTTFRQSIPVPGDIQIAWGKGADRIDFLFWKFVKWR
ncbi:hypothetical protein ACHAXT_001367 [Thalassiosira profunda]